MVEKQMKPPFCEKADSSFEQWVNKRNRLTSAKFQLEKSLNDIDIEPRKGTYAVPCLLNGTSSSDESSILGNVLIWGSVENEQVKLLVDTGAAISVISESFFNSALRMHYSLQTPRNGLESIQTANGATVAVKGFVTFPLTIGNEHYECQASVVSGLAYNVVLGRDFLHKTHAVIDVPGHIVTFKNDNTVSFITGNTPPLLCSVAVFSSFVIEPRSEAIIPVQLLQSHSSSVAGLVEGNEKLTSRYRLLPAASISCPTSEGNVSFRLLNPSDEPVLLHKGTVIGTFSELLHTDIVPLKSSVSAMDSAPQHHSLLSELESIKNVDLSEAQNAALSQLLLSYKDIFASSSLDLGHTSIIEHEIYTGDARPIKSSPYRVSQLQREEIETQISNMLSQNVIQPSSSPWSSPVVLVKKKDGTTRFCVDYRKLNAVTRKDSYPLPRIDDALDALSGSQFFTTLDLQSGYHQVAMHPSSREKTAFVSHAGLFEYNVMSFGLTNAPPTFQRLMSRVLAGLEWKVCLIYIDDIIVFSSTFEEHLQRLSLVFDRIRQANLKLKPSKCHFARHSVKFLGFIVSANGISADPDKLEVVNSFPVPSNVKDVRSFLGLCNYYRRFVHDFARIASPINQLTRKDVKFVWSAECQHAFNLLKQSLCSNPVLAYPVFSEPFHLYTDASNSALGYIIGQRVEGVEYVVAYGGRELNNAEKRYSTTKREALAVVDGIKRYQPYLHGRKFFVHTDHSSLSWLMNVKDPTGRLARWALQLQQYDFDIVYRPGPSNNNADALSRRSYSSTTVSGLSPPMASIRHPCPAPPQLTKLQREDCDLFAIIEYLECSLVPDDNNKARTLLLTVDTYYLDENGVLCHLWTPSKRHVQSLCSQVVIPASLRREILIACHDEPTAGHLSVFKTYEKIRSRYYWHGMYKDVEHWFTSCIDCSMKKVPRGKKKAPLLPIPVEGAFDRVAMDVLGPFPVTNDGNRYIVVFSDYYTRWPEAFALPSTEASLIANLLVDKILARHGAPKTLLSDRGSNFLASIVTEVCKLLNTRQLRTTSYHPQTDGLVERFNGTLAEALSMYVSSNQRDWDRHLPLVLFAYRVSPHATTHESPFYLLYGREPRLPIDASLILPSTAKLSSSVAEHRARIVENLENAHRIVKTNTELAQQRMKHYYDQNSAPVSFDIGSKVWVYTPKTRKGLSKKLAHNYHGPYRVVKKLSPVHFRLRTLDNRPVSVPVHANRM